MPIESKPTILILGADDSVPRLMDAHDLSRALERFELHFADAPRPDHLPDKVMCYRPSVLHLCGYTPLVAADPRTIARAFAICLPTIRCVVLDGCYSPELANQIAGVVDVVIGIPEPLDHDAAWEFVARFYERLGYGESFEVALVALTMGDIAANLRPMLHVRSAVNLARLRLPVPAWSPIDMEAPGRTVPLPWLLLIATGTFLIAFASIVIATIQIKSEKDVHGTDESPGTEKSETATGTGPR